MFVLTMVLKSKGSTMSFTAIYQKVPEGYIAFVDELAGKEIIREEIEISV